MTKWLNNNKSETKKRSCYERLKKGVTFAELIGDLHDRSSERERETKKEDTLRKKVCTTYFEVRKKVPFFWRVFKIALQMLCLSEEGSILRWA